MKCLLFVACLVPAAGLAQGIDWAFDSTASAISTDNLERLPERGDRTTVLTGTAALGIRGASRKLDVDALLGAEYQYASVDGVSDEVFPNINALLRATLLENKVEWTLNEHLGQRGSNTNRGLIISDRENVNVISTGPNLRFDFGSGYSMPIQARIGRADFEDSTLDSRRYSDSAGLQK
jgi:hypothetical protein